MWLLNIAPRILSQSHLVPIFLIVFSLMLRKLWRLLTIEIDPQEPPSIQPVVPFVGHLIGLMRNPHIYLFNLQ